VQKESEFRGLVRCLHRLFFGFVVLDDQDVGSKIKGVELLLRYSLDARLQTTLGFRV